VAPAAERLAYLVNSDNANTRRHAPEIDVAARKLGKQLVTIRARHAGELVAAFETMKRQRAGAVVVADDAVLNAAHRQIAALAVERRLPALFAAAYAAEEALLVYGPSFERMGYRGAAFVDKILKGAKPGDLPIEGPTEFEFIVNLRVAKALGLTVPDTVMLQATRVIE
jgi:putative ABC transport system substrate-binding protein